MPQKIHHFVVFGATSFVGQLLTRYLYQRHGIGGEVKWAIAGRSTAKLDQVRQSLGPDGRSLPMIVCDAGDEIALRELCSTTRVVVSTVGPYAFYGSPLVKVCAETGTDYCDLTGEVQWIRRMITAHEATAQKSGARIVHCCGFDSIPSDLGVHFLQAQARAKFGVPAQRVKLRIKAFRGGFSGGTVASLMNVLKEVGEDPSLRKELGDPYSITPPSAAPRPRQPDVNLAEYDDDARSWIAPFVMAAINTRIVHRSNGLSGQAYGADFRYDEAMMTGSGLKGRATAWGITAGLGGFVLAGALKPTRSLLERYVLPKPGEGPTPEAQERGFYDLRFIGKTAAGDVLRCKLTGDRDPGYGSTAKMLGEAVACLAFDVSRAEVKGGFWTPATAMGDRLIERLKAHAGLTFETL